MTTNLTRDLTYDAPAADVVAMLADASFREQVCEAQHVLRHHVTVTGDVAAHRHVVTIEEVQSARGLPSFATRLVGDEITIVQRESWTSPTEADVHVTVPGKPGEMVGTIRLREAGGTTTETVDLDIRVRVPLVGGKIEGLVSEMLLKGLLTEERLGRVYLSG